MSDSENPIKLGLTLAAPDLDEAALDRVARDLLGELRDSDGIDGAELRSRAAHAGIEKSGGGAEPGGLWAWVKWENLQKLVDTLREFLGGRAIKLEVELPGGGKVLIDTRNPRDFDAAVEKARELLASARKKK